MDTHHPSIKKGGSGSVQSLGVQVHSQIIHLLVLAAGLNFLTRREHSESGKSLCFEQSECLDLKPN
jgi:hypothetical protein